MRCPGRLRFLAAMSFHQPIGEGGAGIDCCPMFSRIEESNTVVGFV